MVYFNEMLGQRVHNSKISLNVNGNPLSNRLKKPLQLFFTSIAIELVLNLPPRVITPPGNIQLIDNARITVVNEINKHLISFQSKCYNRDEIQPIILRRDSHVITPFLYHIFIRSI